MMVLFILYSGVPTGNACFELAEQAGNTGSLILYTPSTSPVPCSFLSALSTSAS
jgi:hypothetical protein